MLAGNHQVGDLWPQEVKQVRRFIVEVLSPPRRDGRPNRSTHGGGDELAVKPADKVGLRPRLLKSGKQLRDRVDGPISSVHMGEIHNSEETRVQWTGGGLVRSQRRLLNPACNKSGSAGATPRYRRRLTEDENGFARNLANRTWNR